MPASPPQDADAVVAERAADHAAIDRLADELLPALIAKLAATGLGELEVREGGWRVRLRRPAAATAKRSAERAGSRLVRTARHAAVASAHAGRPAAAMAATAVTAPTRRRSVATSPAVGIFQPRTGVRAGTRVRAGDRLGVVDMLGVRPGGRRPGRRRRRREPRRAGRGGRVRPGARSSSSWPRPPPPGTPDRCSARSSSPTAARSRCASCAPAGSWASRRSSPTARPTATRCRSSSPTRRSASARPTRKRSYLSAPAVISAALVTGCDAIHPGYGFLSEDEAFAEVVARPRPDVHRPARPGCSSGSPARPATRRLLGAHGLPDDPGLGRHAPRRDARPRPRPSGSATRS